MARKYKPRPKKVWTETALKHAIAESEKNNFLDCKKLLFLLFNLFVKSFKSSLHCFIEGFMLYCVLQTLYWTVNIITTE